MAFDNQTILSHFQGMVQLPTLSDADFSKVDLQVFYQFHNYLEQTYPLVHKHLTREVVGEASLLYTWQGDGSSSALPVAFMAHMDVVPVGEESRWTHPPFGGVVADGYIWGRGTLDTKCQIVAQLEAVEALLKEGYCPPTDVYLCYGHNEEVMGAGDPSGAQAIVEVLRGRGVRLGCVIDEGGSVIAGSTLGISKRMAVIGLAEKGSADFELSATDPGGHSSQPRAGTAVGRIAKVAVKIEKYPLPSRLIAPVRETLLAVAPYMEGATSKLLARLDQTWPVVKGALAKMPATNAMTRTTLAVTMATGSAQANILPERATITVNSRILPGDTMETVEQHLRRLAGPGVQVRRLKGQDPSPESKTDGPYPMMTQLVGELFPDAVVASYLMLGGSDARYYYAISDHVYRFAPFYFDEQSLPTAHAIDERMPSDGFDVAATFYREFLLRYGR